MLEASLADNTRRSYKSSFAAFREWCAVRGYCSLPAKPETVAEYLADLIVSGKRAATAKSHAAAIAHEHRRSSLSIPTETYLVRSVLRGSKRLRGGYVDRKLSISALEIAELFVGIPATLAGKRDKALIALGFGGALRRSELIALNFEDLEFTPGGLVLTIRASKTDPERKGVLVGIPEGSNLKIVSIVRDWIGAAGITRGALFRPVYGNRVVSRHVNPILVSRVLKRYLKNMGLDPALYGAHSLRAGFITNAAVEGVNLERIMDHSRHATVQNVRAYVRRSNLLRDHPGANFL